MILISHVTCSAFGLGGDCDVAAAGSLVLKLVVGLCALGVLSASDQVGGVLSPGSINGANVRPGSAPHGVVGAGEPWGRASGARSCDVA